jgi:hypothetical protein
LVLPNRDGELDKKRRGRKMKGWTRKNAPVFYLCNRGLTRAHMWRGRRW